MDLVRQLDSGEGNFILFGLTPPRGNTPPDRLQTIAERTLSRLQSADPDGVVLYDILEEQDRNPSERPFPFLPTLDPADFLSEYLSEWGKPAVVYRAVGKYPEKTLQTWFESQDRDRILPVLVGASSRQSTGFTSLRRAYALRQETRPSLVTGAVVIPERHTSKGNEHLRMLDKQAAGCSFFISQVLYDVNAAKDLVSDYRDECDARGIQPRPIAFTLSVCGSLKTLEFLTWLGVRVPRWMQRDLQRSDDTLAASSEHARAVAEDIVAFCRRLEIPVGLNVESVSSRRVEIDAAVQLAVDARALLGS